MKDNDNFVEDFEPRRSGVEYIFSGMVEQLKEGECYSREDLINMGAHRNDRGNIDGNKKDGCPSVIVCFMLRKWDEDQFQFPTYEAGDNLRPMAMLRSSHEQKPIRVFCSSQGNREKGKFFPLSPDPKRTVYCYDGLYYIICAKSLDDNEATKGMDSKDARVFFMVRAEPSDTMKVSIQGNPSIRGYVPSENCSLPKSQELHSMVQPWSNNAFQEWNPRGCGL
jgi:hypothetical protein